MANFKWTDHDKSDSDRYVVVLMISRNKDNKDVADFVERRESYFCKFNLDKIYKRFNYFVKEGKSGEFSRLYISLNSRDPEKVQKKLLHKLIDEQINFTYLNSEIAGLAAQHDCSNEKQWFFDFDSKNELFVEEFIRDINKIDNTVIVDKFETPHGYAITASHGFDTRELLSNWKSIIDVELKRDDLICYNWSINEEENH